MVDRNTTDTDYERSAAGLDYEDPIRERAASMGQTVGEQGPGALLEELENVLPEEWRERIRAYPITAVLLGLGVGVFLGMKKGDELLAAGASMVSAAAMANVNSVIGRTGGEK